MIENKILDDRGEKCRLSRLMKRLIVCKFSALMQVQNKITDLIQNWSLKLLNRPAAPHHVIFKIIKFQTIIINDVLRIPNNNVIENSKIENLQRGFPWSQITILKN